MAVLEHSNITEAIIGAVIEVHRILGPGLLESAYEDCLCHELKLTGKKVGLLINFCVPALKNGIVRRVL